MTPTLPLDFVAIRKAIVESVQADTGLVCVKAEPENQHGKRPDLPYFTMKITTPASAYGNDTADFDSDTDKFVYGGPRKMTVSFQCYARSHEEAYNYMHLWHTVLGTEVTMARLRQAGISVLTWGTVADLSALLNTGYEGRAQMDVQFGLASNLAVDLGIIEQVTVQGTVTTDQGNQVNTTTTVTGV